MLSFGRSGLRRTRRGCRGMTGGKRLDANSIADLQLVGPRDLFARAAVIDGDHVALADAILGHMRRAGVAHVLALGELLPRNHAPGIPADFAATAVRRRYRRPKLETAPRG